MTSFRPILAAGSLSVAMAAVSMLLAAAPAGAAGADVTVTIANFTFDPREITIVPGTTVTWVNGDDIPHTVTATAGAFRSKALDTDDRFSVTFREPGDYAYFCSLHPHMTGKIVVKADPK